MNDYDPVRASEQVFVAGCDDKPVRTDSPCANPPSGPLQDWHRADIIAAIRKTGTTLAALSRLHYRATSTLSNVMYRKWPKGEAIIAEHLKVPPWVIWPSRYPQYYQAGGNTGNVTGSQPFPYAVHQGPESV